MLTEKHPDKKKMKMIKNPVTLVASISLVSFLVVVESQNVRGPDKCCHSYYPRRVSKRSVVSYKCADERCPQNGVIFTTTSGQQFCSNPYESWVQDIIKGIHEVQIQTVTRPVTQETYYEDEHCSFDGAGLDGCCYINYSHRLRQDNVKIYKYTGRQCPKRAVIFTIMNGKEFCVDPSELWVQNIIQAKDQVQTASRPVNTPSNVEC